VFTHEQDVKIPVTLAKSMFCAATERKERYLEKNRLYDSTHEKVMKTPGFLAGAKQIFIRKVDRHLSE
jgi:hypothetical protein